jgi:ribonuclease BN (tRNA processing enzyme)
MFAESEYNRCKGWGHSTWQKGVELCHAADVGALAIFHLYPQHDDAYLRGVEAELKAAMPTAFIAREGQAMAFAPVA